MGDVGHLHDIACGGFLAQNGRLVALLLVLALAQAFVVVALALLWIDALWALLPISHQRGSSWFRRFYDVDLRLGYRDRPTDVEPESPPDLGE
jgi:hypothetical protein